MTQVSSNHPDESARAGSISPEIIGRLENFFEFAEPNKFRENLIEMYHSYILHEHHNLPYHFKELSESVMIFLKFLEFTNEEFKRQAQAKSIEAAEI